MKRIGVPLLLLALATGGAAEAQITARPGDGTLTANVGQALDVPVVVDMSAHPALLGAFAMRLTWNPAVLQFEAGLPGSFGAVTVREDSAAQGVLRLAGANPAGVGGGPVIVAVGRFTPLIADTTTVALAVQQLYAAGSFADLLPSTATASAFFCPGLGRYGDIDGDGSANSRDALIALSNAVGLDVSQFPIVLGDVDADGSTNARDALIILSAAVGIDVGGYRVLATAGGACSSGPPVALAIEPGITGDLLAGQVVQFEARATDVGGVLQPVTDVSWRTSDPRVMGILANGLAVARDTGLVDVVVVRDGRDTAFVAVRVVPRRTQHVVASTAIGAVNRLGTAALPFANLQEAMDVAQDGDTVQVRVGRYTDITFVDHAVTIVGDTLPDGTRPGFASAGAAAPVTFTISSPGTVRLEQLAFDGVPAAINALGGGRLELDGLRVLQVQNGLFVQSDHEAIVIRRSRFSGTPQYGGAGLSVYGHVDTVRIEDTEFGDFPGYGVQVMGFDRLEVLRTTFRDQYDGLQAGTGDTLSRSGDVMVTGSRFLRHYGDGLHLRAVGDVTIRDSYFELLEYDPAVRVSGGRTVRMSRDTIVAIETGSASWLDVDVADSVLLDSLDGQLQDAEGYTYNVPYVRLARSTFREMRYATGIEVGFGGGPQGSGVVVVDSVTMLGAASCQQCGTAVEAYDARVSVDRLHAVNLYTGVRSIGDSALTVTRSHFQSVYRGVEVSSYSASRTAAATVTQSTFLGFNDEAIYVEGALTADSNTIDGGYTAIDRPSYSGVGHAVTITRNRIANVDVGAQVMISDSGLTGVITDNVMTGIAQTGIQADGDMSPDTLQVRFEVLRNSVTCAGSGGSTGIRVTNAHALVTDNATTCRGGIELSAYEYTSPAVRRDSVLRNTVTLVRENPNHGDGIVLLDNLRSTVAGNTITGDSAVSGSFGGIVVRQYNCSPCFTVATIDSNVVQQTGGAGIRIESGDSVTVTRNQVLDVATRAGMAAVDLSSAYVRGHARIHGNEIRRTRDPLAYGSGWAIYLYQYDTASVTVDSNLVSDNVRGIYLDSYSGVPITATRNRIRLSAFEGVQVGFSAAQTSVTTNNFFQNGFGMRAYAPVTATNNWWNDANGPACAIGGPCTGGAVADSVDFTTVTFTPFATSELAFTPPNAAPPAVRPAPGVTALRPASAPARPSTARPAPRGTPEERSAARRAARDAKLARRAAEQARDDADHERHQRAIRERRP